MESVWTVFKLSNESVGSRRELVANCVHTADADATQIDSCVASAVCIGALSSQRKPQHPVVNFVIFTYFARLLL